jgi:hypothetical protein
MMTLCAVLPPRGRMMSCVPVRGAAGEAELLHQLRRLYGLPGQGLGLDQLHGRAF